MKTLILLTALLFAASASADMTAGDHYVDPRGGLITMPKWHCALPLIPTDPIVCLDARVYTCPSAQNVKEMKATLKDLALGALLRYYYYDSKTARHHLNGYRYRIGK